METRKEIFTLMIVIAMVGVMAVVALGGIVSLFIVRGVEAEPLDYATLVERILDDPRIVSSRDRICLVQADLIFGNGEQDFGPYIAAVCGTIGIVGVDDSNEVPYN